MPQHALVVDDDLDTCKLTEAILRSADIEALISVNSVQAVELLGNQKFDAVFLDVSSLVWPAYGSPSLDNIRMDGSKRLQDFLLPLMLGNNQCSG